MVTSFLGVLHLIHVIFAFFLFLVNDRFIFSTVHPNNLGRDSDNSHITRYIRYNNGSCPYFGLGPRSKSIQERPLLREFLSTTGQVSLLGKQLLLKKALCSTMG